jgi:predicted nucleotidyltransferase component of viral defense system
MGLLAQLCRETAALENVQPFEVEKDFFLTRLLWAIGQVAGESLLLKGGTLLSKVDLEFRRMSEDADLVLPRPPSSRRRDNVLALNQVRDWLKALAGPVGVTMPLPDGEHSENGAHRIWTLPYASEFGQQSVTLEVSLRKVLRPHRRVHLEQLLHDELVGSYDAAFCFALDEHEARAEKVRAAHTREAIRDFYDLEQLALAGKDFQSRSFVKLTDAKLVELGAPSLNEQGPSFGMTDARRKQLNASLKKELPAVLRTNAPPFDLDATLRRFNTLWNKS